MFDCILGAGVKVVRSLQVSDHGNYMGLPVAVDLLVPAGVSDEWIR